MRLSRAQRKVLKYLAEAGHATERRIAREVFDAPTTTFGRPMLLGVPSVMRALDARGLVRLRPERSLMNARSWEINEAGLAVCSREDDRRSRLRRVL